MHHQELKTSQRLPRDPKSGVVDNAPNRGRSGKASSVTDTLSHHPHPQHHQITAEDSNDSGLSSEHSIASRENKIFASQSLSASKALSESHHHPYSEHLSPNSCALRGSPSQSSTPVARAGVHSSNAPSSQSTKLSYQFTSPVEDSSVPYSHDTSNTHPSITARSVTFRSPSHGFVDDTNLPRSQRNTASDYFQRRTREEPSSSPTSTQAMRNSSRERIAPGAVDHHQHMDYPPDRHPHNRAVSRYDSGVSSNSSRPTHYSTAPEYSRNYSSNNYGVSSSSIETSSEAIPNAGQTNSSKYSSNNHPNTSYHRNYRQHHDKTASRLHWGPPHQQNHPVGYASDSEVTDYYPQSSYRTAVHRTGSNQPALHRNEADFLPPSSMRSTNMDPHFSSARPHRDSVSDTSAMPSRSTGHSRAALTPHGHHLMGSRRAPLPGEDISNPNIGHSSFHPAYPSSAGSGAGRQSIHQHSTSTQLPHRLTSSSTAYHSQHRGSGPIPGVNARVTSRSMAAASSSHAGYPGYSGNTSDGEEIANYHYSQTSTPGAGAFAQGRALSVNMNEFRTLVSERSSRLFPCSGGNWSVSTSLASLHQAAQMEQSSGSTQVKNFSERQDNNETDPALIANEEVEEGVEGMLVLRIIGGTGLGSSHAVLRDLYCVVETDSLRKARTMIRTNAENFEWDETFELDLENTLYLSLLLYQWDPRSRHRLCFYGNVNLHRLHSELLRRQGELHEKLALKLEPKGLLLIEVDFLDVQQIFSRYPATHPSAVFGTPLEMVIHRQQQLYPSTTNIRVPFVVKRCVDEVDKRGLEVVGIYRLNGSVKLKSHIRDMFERNAIDATLDPDTVPDIHAVTAVLKDYLRELPEPLFTNSLYRMIVDAVMVTNAAPTDFSKDHRRPGAKLMLNILECLPPRNQDTILFLLDHLKRVIRKNEVNKMTVENIAICFGPILLCPNPATLQTLDDSYFSLRRQVEILKFILDIWPEVESLQPQSQEISQKHPVRPALRRQDSWTTGDARGGRGTAAVSLGATETSQFDGSGHHQPPYSFPVEDVPYNVPVRGSSHHPHLSATRSGSAFPAPANSSQYGNQNSQHIPPRRSSSLESHSRSLTSRLAEPASHGYHGSIASGRAQQQPSGPVPVMAGVNTSPSHPSTRFSSTHSYAPSRPHTNPSPHHYRTQMGHFSHGSRPP